MLVALRDDDLLVVDITRLHVLEYNWFSFAVVAVYPPLVHLREPYVDRAVIPAGLPDDLGVLLGGFLPPGYLIGLDGCAQGLP